MPCALGRPRSFFDESQSGLQLKSKPLFSCCRLMVGPPGTTNCTFTAHIFLFTQDGTTHTEFGLFRTGPVFVRLTVSRWRSGVYNKPFRHTIPVRRSTTTSQSYTGILRVWLLIVGSLISFKGSNVAWNVQTTWPTITKWTLLFPGQSQPARQSDQTSSFAL